MSTGLTDSTTEHRKTDRAWVRAETAAECTKAFHYNLSHFRCIGDLAKREQPPSADDWSFTICYWSTS